MDNIKSNKVFQLAACLIAITFSILFKIQDIFPQQNKYIFEKFKINGDNFSNEIYHVVKDKKGFLWFATFNGLQRFDGYNIKKYIHNNYDSNSISANFTTFVCDDENYLWIGTYNGGLNRFNKTTEEFKVYKYNPDDTTSISNDNVETILITKKGDMWVGTEVGLNKFDRQTETFTRYIRNINDTLGTPGLDFVYALCEDEENYLWIGGFAEGLDRFDTKNNTFKHYKFNPVDSFSLSDNSITDILQDANGYIWISTWAGGVNKFDKKNEIFYRIKSDSLNKNSLIGNRIYSISKGKNQLLWFGGQDGISIYDPDKYNFVNLRKNINGCLSEISKILMDEMGIVWVCSFDNGFNIINLKQYKFEHYENIHKDEKNSVSNNILSICDDVNGNLWLGTRNGIYIRNKKMEIIENFQNDPKDSLSLRNNQVTYIYRDKNNYMWVSTSGALQKYDPKTGKFILFYTFENDNHCIIYEDKEEHLWIGLYKGGIIVLDKDRKQIKRLLNTEISFKDSSTLNIYNIYEDSRYNMWISTYQGLACFNPKDEKTVFYNYNYKDSNSLNTNKIIGVQEDNTGYIWIATYGGGLNKLDPTTNVFKHYTEDSGLSNSFIRAMLFDNMGNLWLSTATGISTFNPNNNLFKNYGLDNGTQGSYFYFLSCYKTKDGKVFFGGENGFNSFYPDSIPVNNNIPTIVLTDFRIFNKEVKLDTSITEKKKITISHKENFFSFDYASLDYTNPEKNQHAYMLEGIDEDWNYVGNTRTANYTNIEPGEYVFRVKGSNNDGVWCNVGAEVRIIITPPWYKTIWFKVLTAILLTSGIGFIFSQRIKKISKEKKQQEEFTKKLIESQESERKRVAAELHDSLGQDLLIIKNKALVSLKKSDDVAKLKKDLSEISDLTSSTINEVREISYNLRPYELDRMGLLKTLQALIDRAGKSTNISFSCDIDNIDKVFDPEVEINIYRIVQECLTNIIKHSEATQVIVRITKFEKQISIFISDNGKGFDVTKKFSDKERKGFGLRGIPERVKLFGGEFNIESEPGKGTRIKIVVPFK